MTTTTFSPIYDSIACQTSISAGAKLAYSRLQRYASKTGTAWPKVSTLASAIGSSVRQTYRYLSELSSAGLIQRHRRGQGRSNLYTFPPDGTSRTVTDGTSSPLEVKETTGMKTPPGPFSPPPPDPPPPISLHLENLCLQIERANRPGPPGASERPRFDPRQFVGASLRAQQHPEAIAEALNGVLRNLPHLREPWAYANRVLAVQSGNYHERDHHRATRALADESTSSGVCARLVAMFRSR